MSKRLPSVSPRKVIQALIRAGYSIERVKGSHHHLRHPNHPKVMVTVALHTGDIKPKTLRAIIEQTRLTIDEFLELL
jgi:predicted RNA binding protein YcfA (HicA-like mRNA interferase family)